MVGASKLLIELHYFECLSKLGLQLAENSRKLTCKVSSICSIGEAAVLVSLVLILLSFPLLEQL